jgi:hypothetical protein
VAATDPVDPLKDVLCAAEEARAALQALPLNGVAKTIVALTRMAGIESATLPAPDVAADAPSYTSRTATRYGSSGVEARRRWERRLERLARGREQLVEVREL